MDPLDDAQQRELDYQLSQETWSAHPWWVRLLFALGLSLVIAGPLGLFFRQATPHWPWYAAIAWLAVLAAFAPLVCSPRRFVRSNFLLYTVSDADARRAKRFGSLSMPERDQDKD